MAALNLKTPTQYEIDDPEVETRPAELKRWIDGLPYADTNTVIEEITKALNGLNKQKIPAQIRLTLLDIYNHPVNFVLKALEDDYLRPNRRATNRKDVRDNIARNLLNTLALGYKMAVIDALNQKKLWGQEKLVTLAIQRSIRSLSQLVIVHFLTYTEITSGIWNEIYQLYSYAEENKLADIIVKEVNDHEISPAVCFKQILLTGLIGAYGLRPAEIMSVYRYLENHAKIIRLGAVKKVPDPYGHFVVNLRSDDRAWPYAQLREVKEMEHWRLIRTDELLIIVTHDIKALRKGKKPANVGFTAIHSTHRCIELLKHLHVSWGTAAMRHHRRETAAGSVNVVNGLKAIYYFLNGEKSFDPDKYAEPVDHDSINITSQSNSFSRSGGETFSRCNFNLLNTSEGGIAIHTQTSEQLPMQVGQVIGIETPVNKWNVGIIRWFHNKDGQKLEAGIQYITTDAKAITVRSNVGGKVETEFREGVMFTKTDPESKTVTHALLAPSGLFKPERHLKIDMGDKIIDVVAEVLIESSNFFDQIRVRIK